MTLLMMVPPINAAAMRAAAVPVMRFMARSVAIGDQERVWMSPPTFTVP
jgi:hypothetical protein